MKNYTDYMDDISVDAQLHNKIMKRATQNPVPRRPNRAGHRYAGIAACAAVLLLCVWAIPGLFIHPAKNAPDHLGEIGQGDIYLVSPGNQQGGQQVGTITDDPSDPNSAAYPLYPLTLNRADSQIAEDIYIPGHFWYSLTDQQLQATLPDFPFAISATANHAGDGSLFNVVAHELSADGNTARFAEHYTRTQILFAPGEVVEDVVYDDEAVTSDVCGIPVTAGAFDGTKNDGVSLYIASFKLEDIAFSIKLCDSDEGEEGLNRLTEIVNAIIRNGAPDMTVFNDPVIPELLDERLSLTQARSDVDFGAYLPQSVPSGFEFDSATRFINQISNSLTSHWYNGYDHIDWQVSTPTDYDREHVVSAGDQEKYDLSLYPIPRADSVPIELREYVDNPVFLADELTLDVIQKRAYQVDDGGDTSGWRMDFSVLYDDVLVGVNMKGVSPEQVWEMFP